MVITSVDNQKIKTIRALKEKKYRDELGKYHIEGYRVVKDSLDYLSEPELIFSESSFNKYADEFPRRSYIVVADGVFAKLCDTENNQGVICVANIKKATPDYNAEYALFLDRIRDPGNMGTIIRTALATGFIDVYCYDCVDCYNPKVVRSAMSAISRVNIFKSDESTLTQLKENGYTIISADMGGANAFKYEKKLKKACLCIGNEANGLSDNVITASDEVLCLPMLSGESLNAGVSASVLMYLLAFGNKID